MILSTTTKKNTSHINRKLIVWMLDLRLCEDSLLRSRNKIRHPPKAEPFSSSVEAIRIIVISNFVYFIIFLVYRILFNFLSLN